MVEIEKKYKINVKKFGIINLEGFISLYLRECSRFFVVWAQTLLSPLVSSLLFLTVLTLAIGKDRSDVLGYSFIIFLAPGLIIQSMILQSFSHSTSSLMISKMQGNIVDILMPPLSSTELLLGLSFGGASRGIVVGFIVSITLYIFVPLQISNVIFIIIFSVLSSMLLAVIGVVVGIWAYKFDEIATITNFIITPLSFLSGTFYSVDRLPLFFQKITLFNPFFYMIDGFRSGFIGYSDSNIYIGILYLLFLNFFMFSLGYIMLSTGYKLKS